MGVMFLLLAGCRLMFTATIMVDITVVRHSVPVREKPMVGRILSLGKATHHSTYHFTSDYFMNQV